VYLSTRKLIHSAGIAKHYTTYSIRHATISKLYSIFLQPENWLGYHLGASSPSSDSSVSTDTPSEISIRNDELSLSSEDTSSDDESISTSGPWNRIHQHNTDTTFR
jgi:hypothetical protein